MEKEIQYKIENKDNRKTRFDKDKDQLLSLQQF